MMRHVLMAFAVLLMLTPSAIAQEAPADGVSLVGTVFLGPGGYTSFISLRPCLVLSWSGREPCWTRAPPFR